MRIFGHRADIFKNDCDGRELVYPPNIKQLRLHSRGIQLPPNYPQGMTHLSFIFEYEYELSNLPISLTHLYFCRGFPNNLVLPDNIVHFTLYYNYTKTPIILPKNIRVLSGYKIRKQQFILSNWPSVEKIELVDAWSFERCPILQADWIYYLLEVDLKNSCINKIVYVINLQNRCATNRHNLLVKQTAFYDMVY